MADANYEKEKLQVGSDAAARSAGAYVGSDLGGQVGGMVGPPVIGNIVGNIVGEKVGYDAIQKLGIDEKANKVSKNMERVIGKRNADKVAEVAMTSFGYSITETCVCCPCLPASQLLFFVILGFFCYNCYRLSYGIKYSAGCCTNCSTNFTFKDFPHANSSSMQKEFPCFENITYYLIVGSAVWIAFLPFYLFTLFGNCWRQCCCLFCDPVVCCTAITDLLKRCLCECGNFSFIQFLWFSMCAFQICWTIYGAYWLIHVILEDVYVDKNLIVISVISMVFDLVIIFNEIFHKVYHDQRMREQQLEKQMREAEMPSEGTK